MSSQDVRRIGWVLSGVLCSTFATAQDARLRVQAPETELTAGSEFSGAVLLDTTVDGTQGWSFAVAHDPAVLELLSAENGALTATVNQGRPPDFLFINTEPVGGSGLTMAVVISFLMPVTVDAGEGYELVRARYRVVGDPAQSDPCKPLAGEISFSDVLGVPPVANIVTILGNSTEPELVGATVTVRCPGTLELTRCEGDTENVYLEWALGGSATWDFLFLYRDGEFLTELELDATSYTDKGLEPGDYTYTLVTFVVEDPTLPVLVFAHCTATVIPVTVSGISPVIGYFVGGDVVTITGTAFTMAENTRVTFFSGEEEPLELEVLEVVSEEELTALTPPSPRLGLYSLRLENERGSAELADAFRYGFIRGEANADRKFDISDGVAILGFLFLGEGDLPCLDAADATDDGELDVSDAIRVLSFLFLGGNPPPPPHPEPGLDPTPRTSLGCLEAPAP